MTWVLKKKMIKKKRKTKAQLAKEKTEAKVKRFEEELRSAIGTAMTAAFGFLIALTWRDVIIGWVEKISVKLPVGGKLISAFVVTIICVLGVLAVSKFLAGKNSNK